MTCPQNTEDSARADTKFKLLDSASIPRVVLILLFGEDFQFKDTHTPPTVIHSYDKHEIGGNMK